MSDNGHNLFAAQEAIEAHVKATINWGVYTGGIEEAETLSATNGVLEPHVVLRFSSPQPYTRDSSFGGPTYDGVYATVDAMCVAANDRDARELSTEVTQQLLGFQPNPNCGLLNYDFGGGTFTVISEGSRPQFYISWVSFRHTYAMIHDN